MKVTVLITGQISGNFKLKSAIASYGGEVKEKMFNGFGIVFDTKKAAVAAIRQAYNNLVSEEPDSKGRFGGIRVNRDRTELYYDASSAIIHTTGK